MKFFVCLTLAAATLSAAPLEQRKPKMARSSST